VGLAALFDVSNDLGLQRTLIRPEGTAVKLVRLRPTRCGRTGDARALALAGSRLYAAQVETPAEGRAVTASDASVPSLADQLPEGVRVTMFCNAVILTVSSSATTGDVFGAFTRLVRSMKTPRLLWDLRARDLAQLPPDALRQMVTRMMEEAPRERTGGRSAFVVAGEGDCSVMRQLVAHAEAAGYAVRLAVFRDDRAALDWLFGRASAAAAAADCSAAPPARSRP
jgi:hypothetical protein